MRRRIIAILVPAVAAGTAITISVLATATHILGALGGSTHFWG